MEIVVNGEKKRVVSPLTVSGLLELLDMDSRAVVVEKNLEIVNRGKMEHEEVLDGDRVEIIRLVGGG